ncbi:xyloside xylosyltransferase 1 isoform X3 [Eurytemora carolleeae]|uniref:xyloside xylosyltransferase 1 isoform X3 n=1 Tax=Eurytemora carolleeae TaxID=1294199 RepID=UPI000C76116B|nr:xyloside xylosyltransferase 1 isoform X3 [Eurytemora carolleeae]XP_023325660.1 xyloside xylosyltransferase 1 isoform X3 [Eurytemora carolleeae]|eukprot:XP_023325659.1 xyloside xylosyltransferase 1-like isoform X3 [Eurytemora affinis]
MRDNIHPDMSSKDKYKNDFYYIAPLYHLAFTGLDKVVFIDISDMEFTVDIKELYDEFTKLESSPAILGIGLDLSPHYFGYLKSYIESHPGTDIGKPGKNQGLNTGVVLYRLDKMRVNELYNSFLNKQKIDYLVKKFGYPFALAEQDFFTNLGFMFPDLFHILPCQFNTQTSLQVYRCTGVPLFNTSLTLVSCFQTYSIYFLASSILRHHYRPIPYTFLPVQYSDIITVFKFTV